jgi:hypothetical protein
MKYWALLVLLFAVPAKAGVEELYGTWGGVWSPTFKFTGDHVQYGSPPYPTAHVGFDFHSFTNDFGNLTVEGALSGNVTALSLSGTTVNVTVFYPGEGNPMGYGDIVGTRSGDTITGTFIERSPATAGFIHWEGPVTITKVPEPSALVWLAGILLVRRRR